jgi:2-polyprenyl-3-methyl-5-hydroxy-6-metoxy-1,4-benzoquinol methylase
MKAFDYYLQKRRFIEAEKYIKPKSRLLDIGCNNGEFFHFLSDKNISGTGVDPLFEETQSTQLSNVELIKTEFPTPLLEGKKFDAISALAILEHVPENDQPEFSKACYELLDESGKLFITVPSPLVDLILHILRFFRIIDAMSPEQHYGFKPKEVLPLFHRAGFKLLIHKKFELGLNHLFVFEKLINAKSSSGKYF